MQLSRDDSQLVVFWLLASLAATLLALNFGAASFVDGQYVPVGNDSFYHARRILDAAAGEPGFYQFDPRIHVPEGSWLTWPWAYDYLMSRLLIVADAVLPVDDQMTVLAHLPLLFLVVNTALFTLVAREAGLRKSLIGVALAAFVLSPMIQGLHGVGVVDHHFAELLFVLTAAWLGLRLFRKPESLSRATTLGVVLGIAPAFHNSLFVLQLPVLVAAGIGWLRGHPPAAGASSRLTVSLVAVTLVALLPSATFRDMQFGFATHSWFHLYIAACSATVLILMQRLPATPRGLVIFGAVCTGLAVPLGIELGRGTDFMAGATVMLDEITEVRSPFDMYLRSGELLSVTRFYGGLVLLAPLLIIACIAVACRRGSGARLFFAVFAVFGLGLILVQFRLHPFGWWLLPLSALWFFEQAVERFRWRERPAVAAAVAALLVASYPPVTEQLFLRQPLGLAEQYAFTRPLYLGLADVCAADPGIVLADPDDGHPIRYHTDCSVIANTFLLTPQHGRKVETVKRLFDGTPEALLEASIDVRYVVVRLGGLWRPSADGIEPVPVGEVLAANPLLKRSLSGDELPPGFELLGEIPISDDRGLAYARLVRVLR